MKAAADTAVARLGVAHEQDESMLVVGKPGAPKSAAKPASVRKQAVASASLSAGSTLSSSGSSSPPSGEPAVKARVPAATSKTAAPARRTGEVAEVGAAEDTAEPEEPAPATPAAVARPPQHGPVQIPRPMAKAETFVEGDHVVYPTHGVGRVERIATEEIAGHKLELIHITFEENRMTLRVPVAKARSAGLRKLATRKMFDEALAVLKGRARVKRTMWSRRAQEYEAKINSGDPLSIAEVVRDLHRNAGQPDQSFSERQIYEAAMDRLAAELAALDNTDKMTAVTKLAEFLKTV